MSLLELEDEDEKPRKSDPKPDSKSEPEPEPYKKLIERIKLKIMEETELPPDFLSITVRNIKKNLFRANVYIGEKIKGSLLPKNKVYETYLFEVLHANKPEEEFVITPELNDA